jgi:hypothetical protein
MFRKGDGEVMVRERDGGDNPNTNLTPNPLSPFLGDRDKCVCLA